MPPKELLDLLRHLHSHGTLLPQAKFLDNIFYRIPVIGASNYALYRV